MEHEPNIVCHQYLYGLPAKKGFTLFNGRKKMKRWIAFHDKIKLYGIEKPLLPGRIVLPLLSISKNFTYETNKKTLKNREKKTDLLGFSGPKQ